MKYKHLFWALILIAIGLLILFSNFGWLNFHWLSIWRLWPLILIFWGIAVLPVRDTIKFILVVISLAITFLFFNQLRESQWCFSFNDEHWSWSDECTDDEGDASTYSFKSQLLSVPFDSAISKAVLKMDAAAGTFNIRGEAGDLMQFHKEGDIGDYSMTTNNEHGKTVIHLTLEKNKKIRRMKKNTVTIQLNPGIVWDLDFDIGAASVDMDLSNYRIDTAKIEAGAATIELKLGALNPQTYVQYHAGASSLEVKIPRESACEIRSESFLVSRDFEGFIKKEEGVYQTENYPEGKSKILIQIESAVSSLKVDRY
ncbi:MAG: DUF5668 domain-containing protein [bacterium]